LRRYILYNSTQLPHSQIFKHQIRQFAPQSQLREKYSFLERYFTSCRLSTVNRKSRSRKKLLALEVHTSTVVYYFYTSLLLPPYCTVPQPRQSTLLPSHKHHSFAHPCRPPTSLYIFPLHPKPELRRSQYCSHFSIFHLTAPCLSITIYALVNFREYFTIV
jgi:hypothetical protein